MPPGSTISSERAGAHADRDGDVVAGEQDRLLRHQRHPVAGPGANAPQVARADLSAGAGEPWARHRAGVDGHQVTGPEVLPAGAGPSRPALRPTRGSVRESASTGRPSRACSASWTIRGTSTPTYGARSVLLTTSRSARSMPGPPLRATSPPPATSSTKIWTSTSAGENVAVRLSPPDSTSTTSSGREALLEVLHGHQVGGHVVADRRVRAGAGLDAHDPLLRQDAGRAQEPGVLVGVDVVGDDGELAGSAASSRQTVAMSELLPVPTGPQTPSLRARRVGGQALNNLLVVRAWACAHPSMSGEPVAGISPGTSGSATSSANAVDVGQQADAPRRRVGRVEREQLERGREHGLHVVVGDDARQARRRAGRSPRRSRRAPAAAAAARRWPSRPRPAARSAAPGAAARGPGCATSRAWRRWACAPPTRSPPGPAARRSRRGAEPRRRWPPRCGSRWPAGSGSTPGGRRGPGRRRAPARARRTGCGRRRAAGRRRRSRARVSTAPQNIE